MGLLEQLWDDTLAGPQPENGLGKLRKYSSFTFRPAKEVDAGNVRSSARESSSEEGNQVTRSIMIKKRPGNLTVGNGSPPISPSGSTPPVSPFSAPVSPFSSPASPFSGSRFLRKSWSSNVYERTSNGPRRSPPSNDV